MKILLLKILYCTFLFSLLVTGMASGETVGQLAQSVWYRGVYFDKVRFDTTVIVSLTNDAQQLIATIGRTNQADTTIIMDIDETKWRLPSDWFEVFAVHLSYDQAGDMSSDDQQYRVLQYVAIERWGKDFSGSDETRPNQYTVWGDTLIVEKASVFEDTLAIRYFALPTLAADTSDVIDLPDRYLPMLKEVVIQACIERISFPSRSPRDEGMALTRLVQEALLNRETDGN